MQITRRNLLLGAAAAVPVGALAFSRSKSSNVIATPETPMLTSPGARAVTALVPTTRTIEGAGVRLNRALGARALSMLDPFLLLDEFKSDDPNDYAAGFPSHPHRGFETVTYMIDGAMEHRDSVGNHGRLGPLSAQWMTAGHGIVHSEMPKQERGLMWGFQLWVNLPRAQKMIAPRYQDIQPSLIPEVALERGRVRVIAGKAFDVEGPVTGIAVDPIFVDLALENGADISHPLPADHTAFAFVTSGAARIGNDGREVREGELAVLGSGDSFRVSCDSSNARLLVIAGRPTNEPVARSGPFVMSTKEELDKAWADYRSGVLTQT
jgi:redox-sensitive bicupin YhaK (pirin superfamily)